MKRTCVVLLGIYLGIGLMAAYRAWFQIKALDLKTAESVLRPGSVIETSVISYARTPVDVQLELIQGMHRETIGAQHVPDNEWAFFDPRSRQASQVTVISEEMLGHFEKGKAQVRATAVGREQWTRLPPPVVRELTVEISRN